MKNWYNYRHFFQTFSLLFFNFPLLAPCLKHFPVPVLNCHACPLAAGACPIGTLQHFVIIKKIPFTTIGILGAIGLSTGRFSCGFLCPFGLIQEWLYKIKSLKLKPSYTNIFTKIKYLVLILLVLIIPYYTNDSWFSKLCPVGLLQAGIPLIIIDSSLRSLIGWLFYLKSVILILIVIGSVLIERFWCRLFCPLGAIFSLFNKYCFLKLKVNKTTCSHCGNCSQSCPMSIEIPKSPNSLECIKCFKCLSKCDSISLTNS